MLYLGLRLDTNSELLTLYVVSLKNNTLPVVAQLLLMYIIIMCNYLAVICNRRLLCSIV